MAHEHTEAPPRRARWTMGDTTRRVVVTLLILFALGGIALTATLAVTGTDSTSDALPDAVDRLIPVSGAEVPRQSVVGIDIAEGHDAYLVVNGVEVRDVADGLVKDLGTGVVQFQPGAGLPVESLEPGRNCVVANVWDRIEGEGSTEVVSWCFDAY